MPFVIGIFQAANDRGRNIHQFGQLLLRQSRFGAQGVNLARHLFIRTCFLNGKGGNISEREAMASELYLRRLSGFLIRGEGFPLLETEEIFCR